MTDRWRARCEALLADTERDLMASVGNSSLCAISKRGDRVDGLKYLEGRSAALRDLRRALDRAPADAAHDETLRTWQDHLDLARRREMGPDWIAYRIGGVDALLDLADSAGGAPGQQLPGAAAVAPPPSDPGHEEARQDR